MKCGTDFGGRRRLRLVLACLLLAGGVATRGAMPIAAQEVDSRAAVDALFDEPVAVSVRVKSGRTFVGFVDARSDAKLLWLRFEHGRSTLRRPIAWHRVEHALVGEVRFSADELRRDWERFASAENSSRRAWPSGDATTSRSASTSNGERAIGAARGNLVRALSFDVRYANWDAGAEDDGLAAVIAPLDDGGRPVAAGGTLTVELIGMTGPRSPNWAGIPVAHQGERPTLETWTVQLAAKDFTDGVAHVRLPFTAGDPADDPRLGSFGVVRARFAVPGSELVEAELDPVRLRRLGKIGVARD